MEKQVQTINKDGRIKKRSHQKSDILQYNSPGKYGIAKVLKYTFLIRGLKTLV
jgi:hypothetical protein